MEFQYGSETCLYSLLLIARQTAQLVCLGYKINNSEVHVQSISVRMLQLLVVNKKLQYVCVT